MTFAIVYNSTVHSAHPGLDQVLHAHLIFLYAKCLYDQPLQRFVRPSPVCHTYRSGPCSKCYFSMSPHVHLSVGSSASVGRSVCHNFLKGKEVKLTLHSLIGALVLYLGLLDDCVSIHEIYRATAQVMF